MSPLFRSWPPRLAGRLLLRLLLAAALFGGATTRALAAPWLDETPRVAVLSAFEPEWQLLRARLEEPRSHHVNGVEFVTGRLQGRAVVLLLSGISMTNAAMNTQLVLDRFRVTHLLVSGIAGGVNPALSMGDVTVPARWGQYLEVLFARETRPGRYSAPPWMDDATLPAFGALHPRPVEVRRAGSTGTERRFWFDADPELLAVARRLTTVDLRACDNDQRCLSRRPRLVVGGHGVSGSAFVDNAAFRDYTHRTFDANVLDMETAATAMVAWSNGVPFIAFRSLSDLAGGGEGANEMTTFMAIAADNSARVLLAFLDAWR